MNMMLHLLHCCLEESNEWDQCYDRERNDEYKTECQRIIKHVEMITHVCATSQHDELVSLATKDILQAINHIFAILDGTEEDSTDHSVSSSDDFDKTKSITKHRSELTFDDIVGNQIAKRALFESVVLRFTLDKETKDAIFTGPRKLCGNILLFGPPGCGKTALVEAVASEASIDLLSIRPSDILSKYQGESEKYIRELFNKISSDTILFFDEFDSIAMTRGQSDESGQGRRLLAELLLFLNRTKLEAAIPLKSRDVVVIAATNRLEDIDEAIVRRFDTKVFVNTLNEIDRETFIKKQLVHVTSELTSEQVSCISKKTAGWSGSDIEMLCREAAMRPVRQLFRLSTQIPHSYSIRNINADDFGKYYVSGRLNR